MNWNDFNQKHPKGSYLASLNTKLGTVIGRAGMCMTRARDFKETEVEYRALMFHAEKLLGYAQKMSDEMKTLLVASSSPKTVNTPEQQAVLDECQQWLDTGGDKGAEMPEELWNKFHKMFGEEIEAKYGKTPTTSVPSCGGN